MLAHKYISGGSAVKIAASIEQAVASGKAAAGDRLPSVRQLAAHLGISPATAASAYRLLQRRGMIVSDGRRGSRIRPAAPIAAPAPPPLPPGIRDLADGNPDPALLPRLQRRSAFESRLYRDDLNDPQLMAIAREAFLADAIPAARVGICSGALDGIERVLRETVRPGDRVAVEDPAFTGVVDLLGALDLEAVPFCVDDEGPVPAAFERALRSSRACIVTPRAQNPTGASITRDRARLLRPIIAANKNVTLIEDDHAGPVAGTAYVTLVHEAMRWAVVRSVSKSLGPDLRVAFLAADRPTLARVEGRQSLGIRWVSHILQTLVRDLLADRRTQKLLDRASATYAARRNALLRALSSHGIKAHGRSGLNVWIPVAEEVAVVQGMAACGWGVAAGERYRLTSGPAIRVTVAALQPDEAAQLAADLAAVIGPALTRVRAAV